MRLLIVVAILAAWWWSARRLAALLISDIAGPAPDRVDTLMGHFLGALFVVLIVGGTILAGRGIWAVAGWVTA